MCSRCGSNQQSRPVPPPSVTNGGRPGTMVPRPAPVQTPPSVRDGITGLRYVPTSSK